MQPQDRPSPEPERYKCFRPYVPMAPAAVELQERQTGFRLALHTFVKEQAVSEERGRRTIEQHYMRAETKAEEALMKLDAMLAARDELLIALAGTKTPADELVRHMSWETALFRGVVLDGVDPLAPLPPGQVPLPDAYYSRVLCPLAARQKGWELWTLTANQVELVPGQPLGTLRTSSLLDQANSTGPSGGAQPERTAPDGTPFREPPNRSPASAPNRPPPGASSAHGTQDA